MRTPSRSKSIGAVIEVLFIYRFQQHHNRSLQHLVLKGGNPYGSFLVPRPFRYIHPSYRRRFVCPRLGTLLQALKILHQLLRVLFRRLPINSCRSIFTGLLVRLVHPLLIYHVG